MKKSLLALAVLGAFAGVAQAQSAVTVYGVVDLGLSKTNKGGITSLVNGDNSRLGFKGSEDLGGGLSANFQYEMRFDADTGVTEGNGTRPLLQGRSWVGLAGGFGSLRLGRDLTALQGSTAAFDPWGATRGRGAFSPFMLGSYGSDPLNPANATQNRFSNAVFYSSPAMGGFQANLSVATKEGGTTAITAPNTPISLSGTYANGPIAAVAAYERNAVDAKMWALGGSYNLGPAKLMATYANTDASTTAGLPAGTPVGADGKVWTLGATANLGTGKVLAGYGQQRPDAAGAINTKRFALGYEHPLSKRTYLYTDIINQKAAASTTTFDIGLHHNF